MVQATAAVSTEAQALVAALFGVVRRLKRMQYDEPVEKAGLGVLHVLACSQSPLRLSDVAAELTLDVSTVSRHVRTLEEGGLVARTHAPDDGRACLLGLSPKGAAALQHAYEVRARTIGAALAGWSLTDREHLTALLTQLEADLGASTDGTD
jgi:DNA-binding MarR family transcriptional regulator